MTAGFMGEYQMERRSCCMCLHGGMVPDKAGCDFVY